MQRNILNNLHQWFQGKKRKPLILRGARQIGKSTLVRLFASEIEIELLEINLEVHRDLDVIFSSLDLEVILRNLEGIVGQRIQSGQLLFLDEIQATPHALAMLRYFYEERPDIAVIAAGSLLEFALAKHSFSMPVGRIEYLFMNPMTFMEYLKAMDEFAYETLLEYQFHQEIPLKTHQRLLKHQRNYFLVGGMPEAVDAFRESQSFEEVFKIQNNICHTYMDDFSKYAQEKSLAELQLMFRALPTHIGKKLKYTSLCPDAKSAQAKNLLELLEKARICSKVIHADANGVPLGAEAKPKVFKTIFLDIGLVSRLLQLDWRDLQNEEELTLVNRGILAEQFIGQHLQWDSSQKSELYYWVRESKNSNSELDYVTARGSLVVPIEVKSGKSGTLKSLHQFMFEKKLGHAFRFDSLPPSFQSVESEVSTSQGQQKVNYQLHSLPLYAIERLPTILDEIRNDG